MEKFVIKSGFWALGKGLQAASRLDKLTVKEVEQLPAGFAVTLEVFPGKLAVSWKKEGGSMKYLGLKSLENPDLRVIIKNRKSALRMILAQLGIAKAYAQRRIAVEGNTVYAMVMTRMLDRVEAFLFPRFLSKNLLKQVPRFKAGDYLVNFQIYLRLIV